ncbi:type I Iterative Polyketide synthase (PKS) [Aspergillus brasiliensis]|nr:type I Iterative Polyketide synthase (PKS) [Aspergillus brasiliensis]
MDDKLPPIAIVGMSWRFPSEARSASGFWDILRNGESAKSRIPVDRFDPEAYYHPSADRQGAIITKEGHFLKEDIAAFDAPFFSMTATEAEGMDPQHRILLEVTYEAFENAGMPLRTVAGSQTAVMVGCFTKDYEVTSGRESAYMSPYSSTGCGGAMIANRLSWFYDLRGPSLLIDTACSSSLVGLHLACQEIRSGGSKMAVVAGTNLMIQPEVWRGLSALGFLSPDGQCHSFDSSANGYGRGEGMGVIVLKPLMDAIRDNDVIRAVIRGTGMNQDGKTPGITVPSPEAQRSLIRSTYKAAGLGFSETVYFEAHGTGTPVGDPLELSAIGETIGIARAADGCPPLLVGSVKSNIGHLEGASGIAGLIKTVLVLEQGQIPAVHGIKSPNPRFDLERWNICIPNELTPWPTPGLRRASVNSFGYGGTNSHVILDDAFHYLAERNITANHTTRLHVSSLPSTPDSGISIDPLNNAPNATPKLYVFSAPEQDGVTRIAQAYADFVRDSHDLKQKGSDEGNNSMLDNELRLAYTLAERRTIFDYRGFAVATSLQNLGKALISTSPRATRSLKNPSCAWVFTGQGAQWFAMGRELQEMEVFSDSLRKADEYILSLGSDFSILDELNQSEEKSRINEPRFSQVLCTVVQVALVELLQHWQVRPKAVVGHSSGEIAAAYACGAISRDAAWKIAYFRGLHSQQIAALLPNRQGAMLAVNLSQSGVQPYLDTVTDGAAVVACINSPQSVTVSGDLCAVALVERMLQRDDVWCRMLKVQMAYHSPHMKVIAERYLASIGDVSPTTTKSDVAFFSSVSGAQTPYSSLDAEYWVKNLLSPVRFCDAVTALLSQSSTKVRRKGSPGVNALVEIGPHSALQGPLRDIVAHVPNVNVNSVTYTSLLQRGKSATATALDAAGKLWALGFPLDLGRVNSNTCSPWARCKPLVNLPRYPFNHKRRYWHEARNTRVRRTRTTPRTDLLGLPADDHSTVAPRWTNFISPAEIAWLMDHQIQGIIIFPGAAMLAMVLEACKQVAGPQADSIQGYEFHDVTFSRPMVFPSSVAVVETILQFRPHNIGTRSSSSTASHWTHFNILSMSHDNSAIEHCTGLVRSILASGPNEVDHTVEVLQSWDAYKDEHAAILQRPTKVQPASRLYDRLTNLGLYFGPAFRNITQIHTGDGFGHGELQIKDTAARMPEGVEYPLPIHPTLLDAVFQMMICCRTVKDNSPAMVPSRIDSLYVSASIPPVGSCMSGYSTLNPKLRLQQSGNVVLSDDAWSEPKVILKGFVCTELTSTQLRHTPRKICTRMDWRMDVISSHITAGRFWKSLPVLSPASSKEARAWNRAAILCARKASSTLPQLEGGQVTSPTLARYIDCLKTIAVEPLDGSFGESGNLESCPVMQTIDTVGSGITQILSRSNESEPIVTSDLISKFVNDAIDRSFVNSVVSNFIDRAGDVNPDSHILEVGDGSTSCATSVLRRVAPKSAGCIRLTTYTLAVQESEALFEAETISKEWSSFHSKRLNVEKDAEKQGFEAGSYDYIIMTDLMPTVDLAVALAAVKKLLKPDGKLLVAGITANQPRTAFVLGSDARWWNTPRDEMEWDALLRQAGFRGIEHIVNDSTDPDLRGVSVMMTSTPFSTEYEFSEVVILNRANCPNESNVLSKTVGELLTKRDFSVSHATLDTVPEDLTGKAVVSFLELDDPLLEDMSEHEFVSVRSLIFNSAGMIWVTRQDQVASAASHPFAGVASGLLRTVRSEDSTKRLGNLDLSLETISQDELAASIVYEVFRTVLGTRPSARETRDWEFAEHGGCVYVPRVFEDNELNSAITEIDKIPQASQQPLFQENRPLKMVLREPGLLNTFAFVDDEEFREQLKPDYVEMKVLCTGLNFVDIMAALGQVPTPTLGCEVGGIITHVGSQVTQFKPGDKVVGMLQGSFNSHVRIRSTIIQHVPCHMTVEDGTTAIVSFLTAWIALVNKANLIRNESALIHYGAGGVGQAAIQICQHLGVEIYTTVGSRAKKDLLIDQYGLAEDHIFYSRDTTFAEGLMRMTAGRGVDVVLNSTSGELLRQSWTCVADHGRFVEIGKRDILNNVGLDMGPFIRGVSYIGFNLEMYHQCSPVHMECSRALDEIFHLFRTKRFHPLVPLTVYSYAQVEQAFRALQSGAVSGKIVVQARGDDLVPVVPLVEPPFTVDPNATYLLAGGLGGIGRSIADMLLSHGARHLAFISRSGDSRKEAKIFLDQLRRHGCHVRAYACDISNRAGLQTTLAQCAAEMPPIKGLIQCSMVLKDGVFERMSYGDWITSTRSKIQGSWNLHELAPRDLDFFIMLSSISGVIGNPGQANYAAGNAFEDALALFRRQQGLPATAIDLGAVRDVGYIAESDKAADLAHTAAFQIAEKEVHHLVGLAIAGGPRSKGQGQGQGRGKQVPARIITGLSVTHEMDDVLRRAHWARDAKFSTLWKPGGVGNDDAALQAGLEAISKAESLEAASGIAEDMIVSRVARVLMVPVEDINSAQPLHIYGVDSLVAVEIRAWMASEFQTEISIFDILSPSPLSALATKIVRESKLLPERLRKSTSGEVRGDSLE